MKTGIFYGSSTGTTREIARKIAKELNVDSTDVHDIAVTAPSVVAAYDLLIFGSPTYGNGELQADWYDFIAGIDVLNLKDKRLAIFGTGDETMSESFCDAVGIIYRKMLETGITVVGAYNTFPYKFNKSKAVPVEGAGAVGLLIDNVHHSDSVDKRISDWCKLLN